VEDWIRELVVCPVSRQQLRPAGGEAIAQILSRMEEGLNLPEGLDLSTVQEWWLTEDGHRAYPVVAGVPLLITDRSLVL